MENHPDANQLWSPRPPPTAPVKGTRVKSYNRTIQNRENPPSHRYSSNKSRNGGSTISIKNITASQIGQTYQLPKLLPGKMSLASSHNMINQSTNISKNSSVLSPRQIRNIQNTYLKRRRLTNKNEDAQIVFFPSPGRARDSQSIEKEVSQPSSCAPTAKLRFKTRNNGAKIS